MEKQQRTQASRPRQRGDRLSSNEQPIAQGIHQGQPPRTQRSPLRFLIITIVAIFFAEVVAMLVVYYMKPLPYYQTTLIDAGLMTVLIFPVLYYFSFRPLIRQIEKSWEAEESLRRSRELQEKFFDSIGTLIAYMDCDFNFIHVNEAYARADGHTPDYFVGKNHFVLFPHPENEAIFRGVVKSGEPFSVFEKPFEYPENPERGVTYWDWSLQPVTGSSGRVEGLVLSLLNATERRHAQEKIHQLSRIVEQTEDTVVVTNCDGIIEYVNPAFERLTGYSKEEVFGKTPGVLKSGVHDSHFYQELWNRILAGGVFQSEMANRKKNGELFYEVKTITPLRDAEGRITHFVATGKDITGHKHDEAELLRAYEQLELRVQRRTEELVVANTALLAEINERKKAQNALEQSQKELSASEERARHLIQYAPAAIYEMDFFGQRFLSVNDIACQWTGYTREEILGMSPSDLVDAASQVTFRERVKAKLSRENLEEAVEYRIIAKDGHEIIAEMHVGAFTYKDGKPESVLVVAHDITERKRAEEALQAANEELRRFNRTMVGRELRMIEMKKEVNELCARAGQPRPYALDFEQG